jgi:hypothetical protein
MDLYFTTVHHKFPLPRVRFLMLAQSLEADHRATMPEKYVSDESYNTGLRKLLWDAIPKDPETTGKDFLASLGGKLDHLHQFSLRKRLKELTAKHSPILESLIGTPEAFSAAVADRRNQLTHATEQNQGAADDYRTLWVLCDKMGLLLEVCFLDEIGFTHDRLKQIVTTRSNRARSVHQGWVRARPSFRHCTSSWCPAWQRRNQASRDAPPVWRAAAPPIRPSNSRQRR